MITFDNPTILGAAFTIGGGVAIGGGIFTLHRSWAAEEWPVVDGEITETGLVRDYENNNTLFVPKVRYRYVVDGATHIGDCISFGGPLATSFRWPAERVLSQYPSGSAVRVRVCPTDPLVSVLEPGAHWSVALPLGVGAVFLGIGLVKLLSALGYLAS